MAHEHWDGHSRPRNVDYATRRLGDYEPYPSRGSGGPGDVSRARRGRLEVTLRSYSSVLEYDREGVKHMHHGGLHVYIEGRGAIPSTAASGLQKTSGSGQAAPSLDFRCGTLRVGYW